MKRIIILLAMWIILIPACTQNDSDTGNSGTPGGTNNPGANEVWIQGMQFNPSSITVSAGTTIKWTNKDGVAHTVTSDDGLFDSGNMSSGRTFSFSFPTAGTYKYHCSLHTVMKATVVVN